MQGTVEATAMGQRVAEFKRNGYTIFRGFNAAWIERWRQVFMDHYRRQVGEQQHSAGVGQPRAVLRGMLQEHPDLFLPALAAPRMLDFLEQLMGPSVGFDSLQIAITPAVGEDEARRVYAWHRDMWALPGWTDDYLPPNAVNVLTYLQEGSEYGPLRVIPGSHRGSRLVGTAGPAAGQKDQQELHLAAGDTVVIHSSLLHSTSGNYSGQLRIFASYFYTRAWLPKRDAYGMERMQRVMRAARQRGDRRVARLFEPDADLLARRASSDRGEYTEQGLWQRALGEEGLERARAAAAAATPWPPWASPVQAEAGDQPARQQAAQAAAPPRATAAEPLAPTGSARARLDREAAVLPGAGAEPAGPVIGSAAAGEPSQAAANDQDRQHTPGRPGADQAAAAAACAPAPGSRGHRQASDAAAGPPSHVSGAERTAAAAACCARGRVARDDEQRFGGSGGRVGVPAESDGAAGADAAAELVLNVRAELGEGPVWDAASDTLYWVDLFAGLVHRYQPASGLAGSVEVGEIIGCVVPRQSGGLLAATTTGIYHLDPATGAKTRVSAIEADRPETHFNDGKVDPAGRFWFGSIAVDRTSDVLGDLYSLEPDLTVTHRLAGVDNTNGMDWSPDGRTMYYIDSLTRQVTAYDFDAASGAIANPRPLVTLPEGTGVPDGMTVSADGTLWVAHWGGARVTRWHPATGALLQTIAVPANLTTSCAFAGPALDELYITTARYQEPITALAAQPFAGGLFRYRTNTKGRPAAVFPG